jgi:hypothetical protein
MRGQSQLWTPRGKTVPNALATLVFYGWPLVVAAMFVRMPLERALPWAILAGYLFAPHGMAWNLPLLPTYEKNIATALTALAMCLAFQGAGPRSVDWRAAGWLPRSPALRALTLLFLIQPVFTVLTNLEVTTSGARTLPGLPLTDIGAVVYEAVTALLPFLLARRYLGTPEGRGAALRALAVAGLVYSALVAFEIRFSPQLNRMLYGYTQFDWVQQLRDGGFRPVVFLQHGLWTAIFMAMGLLAAAAIWRSADGPERSLWRAVTLWMALILALSNSLGALILGIPGVLLIRFASPRLQMLSAAMIGVMAMSYPVLRNAELIPTGAIVDAAGAIDIGRGVSLQFRLDNEDALLARANQKPLFGWGGWGRNLIYDAETGAEDSVTDGRWIIVFGQAGWLGYVAEFGLLGLPLVMLWRRGGVPPPAIMAASLALAINMLDMLPNATLTPVTWFLAGLVAAYAENPARREVPSERMQAVALRSGPNPAIGGRSPASATAQSER